MTRRPGVYMSSLLISAGCATSNTIAENPQRESLQIGAACPELSALANHASEPHDSFFEVAMVPEHPPEPVAEWIRAHHIATRQVAGLLVASQGESSGPWISCNGGEPSTGNERVRLTMGPADKVTITIGKARTHLVAADQLPTYAEVGTCKLIVTRYTLGADTKEGLSTLRACRNKQQSGQ